MRHGSVNWADEMESAFFQVSLKLLHTATNGKLAKIVGSLSICMFLLLSVTIVCAINPDRDIHQLAHRSWGERDGYPGQPMAMAQTTDGFLWLGTVDGLFRFDGIHFERYASRSGDKLPEAGAVTSLLAVPDGSLWIGYQGVGIKVLRNGNVRSYGKADGVPLENCICNIVRDHDGTIWASIVIGLIRFNGARWEQVGHEWSFPENVSHTTAFALFVDRQGTLWAGIDHTVLYLKQGAKRFERTGVVADSPASIAEAPDGKMWMADNETYVRAISMSVSAKASKTAQCETHSQVGLPPKCPRGDSSEIQIAAPFNLIFDRRGNLWVTTDTYGLVRVPYPELQTNRPIPDSNSALQKFTSVDGLSADSTDSILEDREGNIWVATRDGLDQFRETALVPVELPKSIGRTGIAPADEGDVWVTGNASMIARIRGDSTKPQWITLDAFKAYRDPGGATWLMGDKLRQWKNGNFQVVAQSPDGLDGTAGDWLVAADRAGTLWAFADGIGFLSLDHHRWKRWPTPPQVAKLSTTEMFCDSSGRVWVSTTKGDVIAMYKGNVVDYPAGPDGPLYTYSDFAEHASQQIWATGGANGLLLIEESRFHFIKPIGVDFSKDILGVVDAGSEGLWLSTKQGVVHVARDEIERALKDSSYRFHWEQFDSTDGLPGKIQNDNPYPKTIQGTDGRIWFVATRGVAWIDPKNISKNAMPPPVSITSISADGSSHVQLTELRLPARTKNVQIDYTALSLSIPERVQFRYKLDGIDREWQDPGPKREAYYSRLPPGQYTFHVIASNNDGIWNATGAMVAFTIPPAWFQTTWFYTLCAAASLLLLWSLYQIRVRYIARAISARFDERLAERTLIARDLHDTLLQTIQGSKLVADSALKRSADPSKIREALEQLSIWLARATTEGRIALNSLRTSTTETNDLAEAFRRATEECRTENSMETSFSVAGDARIMHPIVRDEVYRVGYEAIRNACVHSQASKLRVTLTYADELRVDVSDNGVGIDPLVADRGKEGHFGLQGMRERAARIAGKLTVISSPGSGTQVKLVVPGKIIYRKTTSDNH
jgi:signal transduction histidine kinase/ligand-binding sensor domain-containing protein